MKATATQRRARGTGGLARRIFVAALSTAAALHLTAASASRPAYLSTEQSWPGTAVRVAIPNFAVNARRVPHPRHGRAGAICADALSETLLDSGLFVVVERAQIDRVAQELKLQNSGMVDPAKAAEIGKMLAATYVVFGDVQAVDFCKSRIATGIEIWKKFSGKPFIADGVTGARACARVSFRVVQAETAEVVLQKSVKSDAEVVQVVNDPGKRVQVAGERLERCAQEMGQAMRALGPKLYGHVAQVNDKDGTFVINLGTRQGVQPDMLFRVFEVTAEIKDPITGEVIDRRITEHCVGRCSDARERASTFDAGEMRGARWRSKRDRIHGVRECLQVESILGR